MSDDNPLESIVVDEAHEDAGDLDELVTTAETARKQYHESQNELSRVKSQLSAIVDRIDATYDVPSKPLDQIRSLIERGEYERARDGIREVVSSQRLEFDDSEKRQFAEKFADEWNALVEVVEELRTGLLELQDINGWSRSELVDYLNASHGINKTTTRAVFNALDDAERASSSDPRTMARLLAALNRDLNIEPTTQAVEAIREEAGSR